MPTSTSRPVSGPAPASTGAAVASPGGPARQSAARPHPLGPTGDGPLHKLGNLLGSRRSRTADDPPRAQFKSRGTEAAEPNMASSPRDSGSPRRDANYGPPYSAFARPNSGAIRYGAPGMQGPGGALTALGHGAAALAIGVLGTAAMTTVGFFPLLIGVAAYSYMRRAHHYNLAYGGINPYQGWQQPNPYQGWRQPNPYQGWQQPNPYQGWRQPNPYQGWQQPNPYQGWQQPSW